MIVLRLVGICQTFADTLQALPLLKYAYDKGLNTWDTANMYSNGVSEEIIAKAIEKYSIPRHKLVIMSKLYVVYSPILRYHATASFRKTAD